jgi:hypothetical protein
LEPKEVLYMIEQPWPVILKDCKEEELDNWKKEKEYYEKNGYLIFADESISTLEDISIVKVINDGNFEKFTLIFSHLHMESM